MDPAELDLILNGLPSYGDANLLLGYSNRDDAAVYRLPSGDCIVQTVDFFTPIVDDPYDYGAIAAANSLSDIYAMNGRPLFALNICCFPRKHPAEIWHEVLRGGTEKAMEAGIAIAGGHTVDDAEPKYGLVVTGLVNPNTMWTNKGALLGDVLILTKPIGTGLITTALKNENITADDASDAVRVMKILNRDAAAILAKFEIHACTDITGNGLIGHAVEIAVASQVGMEIRIGDVPLFDLACKLVDGGKFPGGTFSNHDYYGTRVDLDRGVSEIMSWLLFDAQTSGGLLAAVRSDQAIAAIEALQDIGVTDAALIGQVVTGNRIRIKA